MTMTWTVNATLTALQFTPACAVFFLLAFRFALENYQIRKRRKVTVMEYLSAPQRLLAALTQPSTERLRKGRAAPMERRPFVWGRASSRSAARPSAQTSECAGRLQRRSSASPRRPFRSLVVGA